MHRIVLPDGTWRQSKSVRALRTLGYVLIFASGVFLMLSDVLAEAYSSVAEIMTVFLAIGGALCAIGTGSARWWGEFIGLPLVSPAFMVLGILIFRAGFPTAPWIATANMCLLIGSALLLAARWRIVYAIYRTAVAFVSRDREAQ